MFLAIYLEFAQFSERNFGGIAIGKAASEVTTNFCPCGACRKNVFVGALEGTYFPYTLHHTPYTIHLFYMFMSFEGLFTALR